MQGGAPSQRQSRMHVGAMVDQLHAGWRGRGGQAGSVVERRERQRHGESAACRVGGEEGGGPGPQKSGRHARESRGEPHAIEQCG